MAQDFKAITMRDIIAEDLSNKYFLTNYSDKTTTNFLKL